jgi:Domain of unknown function (DUF6901)
MGMFTIEYRLVLPDRQKIKYSLQFDENSIQLMNNLPSELPEWAKLNFKQCAHCPLSVDANLYCPLAANLVNIITRFDGLMSYDNLELEVLTERRTISRSTTVQEALGAILGLVIPTSGCPHTAYFRPMARYHLPLASTDETIYRAASMYLLAQYFRKITGKTAELNLDGLKKIYQNMQILNTAIAERLRAASKTDSSVNALILLDMFALALPFAIEESLEELKSFFNRFLDD